MASGMATCTLTAPVVAAASGTINPATAVLSNLTNVTAAPNNGAGTTPTTITVNPPACAANAGTLGY